MRIFALFMLHMLEFDLTRANSAPVKNMKDIEWIENKIAEWDLILLRETRRLT